MALNNPSAADDAPKLMQVRAEIAEAAAQLGFEYFVHGMRWPLPITQPRTSFFSNYPPAWEQRYREQGYLLIDPTVAHGMRSSAPVVWSDAFFAQTPQLWQEAQAHGLRHGWAQSRRDPEGTYSLLVLARSQGAITADELADKAQSVQWLVHASHERVKSCHTGDAGLAPAPVTLTARETDVLRWTAEGKTSAEIAQILGIAERTVNFHVGTAVDKLGVTNKTSAAVRGHAGPDLVTYKLPVGLNLFAGHHAQAAGLATPGVPTLTGHHQHRRQQAPQRVIAPCMPLPVTCKMNGHQKA